MIQALIFDFDGVILDTETPLIESYGAVHRAHGIAFDRAGFFRAVGQADYAFDPWHGFSPHADRAALEMQRRAQRDELLWRQPILPGVVALLDAAREHRLRLGVASNSEHAWVEPHLRRLGLHDRFEFFACREDAASPKPEPDLYRLVLNHFGLRGSQAIAIEDSRTGVLAAKRAHCHVVAVPNASTLHHDLAPAEVRVGSLAEVSLTALIVKFSPASLPTPAVKAPQDEC